MNPQRAQKPILNRQEIQQHPVQIPRENTRDGTGHGIQNKVVRRRDDGRQDHARIYHAEADDSDPPPREPAASLAQGNGSDGQADEEGVAEVEGGHRGYRMITC